MAQVPAQTYSGTEAIDYTPSGAVVGGDVVVLNGIVGVAVTDIAANEQGSLAVDGNFKLPKTTAAWVRGLPVHWNPTGDPDSGTAGTGAANQLGLGTYAGICIETAASGDDFGKTQLNKQTNLMAVSSITAAGSLISDAAQLTSGLNLVTGADGTKGVILPVAVPGAVVIIKGLTAGVLKVYPKASSTINGLSASGALSVTTGLMPLTFIASSATQWYSLPLVAS
jgi:predicted RecA/RadA family phage recombinase